MAHTKVVLGSERLQIARAIFGLLRVMHRSVLGGSELTLGRDAELLIVTIAVFIGQVEGRPMTPHKLAQFIGMPRTTLLRKLKELERRSVIIGDGAPKLVTEQLNSPDRLSAVRELAAILSTTQRKLSNLDSKLSKLDKLAVDKLGDGVYTPTKPLRH